MNLRLYIKPILIILLLSFSVSCSKRPPNEKTTTTPPPDNPGGNTSYDNGNGTSMETADGASFVDGNTGWSNLSHGVITYVRRQTCSGEEVISSDLVVDFRDIKPKPGLDSSNWHSFDVYCNDEYTKCASKYRQQRFSIAEGADFVIVDYKLSSSLRRDMPVLFFNDLRDSNYNVTFMPELITQQKDYARTPIPFVDQNIHISFPNTKACGKDIGNVKCGIENQCANAPKSHICTFDYGRCNEGSPAPALHTISCNEGYIETEDNTIGTSFGINGGNTKRCVSESDNSEPMAISKEAAVDEKPQPSPASEQSKAIEVAETEEVSTLSNVDNVEGVEDDDVAPLYYGNAEWSNLPYGVRGYVKKQSCSEGKVISSDLVVDFKDVVPASNVDTNRIVSGSMTVYCNDEYSDCNYLNMDNSSDRGRYTHIGKTYSNALSLDVPIIFFNVLKGVDYSVTLMPKIRQRDRLDRRKTDRILFVEDNIYVNFPNTQYCGENVGDVRCDTPNECANAPKSHICTFDYGKCSDGSSEYLHTLSCNEGYVETTDNTVGVSFAVEHKSPRLTKKCVKES